MTVTYFDVDLTVEMAFGYSPTDTPTWTDVSAYVRALETDRGRRDEFGSYSQGSAQITLSNTGRRFDPSYASGAYYPDLVPMVPVRIVATYATVDYPIFYGFVLGWPQQYVNNIDSTVTVTAVDAFRLLEQATLAESAYRKEVDADGPIAYYPFIAGAYVDEVAGNDMRVPYASHSWRANNVGDWTPDAGVEAVTEGGGLLAHLESPAYLSAAPRAIEFVFKFDKSDPNWSAASWNVVARAGAGTDDFFQVFIYGDDIGYSWSNTSDSKYHANQGPFYAFEDGRTYHIVISIDSDGYGRTYVDGVLAGTTAGTGSAGTLSTGATPWVEAHTGQAVAHFAVYDAPLSSTRIAAHYNAGKFAWGGDYVEYPGARIGRVLDDVSWPAGTRDIADGGVELGEYLPNSRGALDYIREIEATEQGLFFVGADGDVVFRDRAWQFTQASQVTFGTGGEEFFDVVPDGNSVDLITNRVKVTYNVDSSVTVEDATSIAAYGYGSDSVSAPTLQTIDPARGLASFLVRVGKDPRSRVSALTVKPRADPANLFPAVLGLELGEVVTVTFTPLGVGSAASFVTSIQGIRHDVERGEWVTELYLAPAVSESGPYWTIGDATKGKIGAAFGNKISY